MSGPVSSTKHWFCGFCGKNIASIGAKAETKVKRWEEHKSACPEYIEYYRRDEDE